MDKKLQALKIEHCDPVEQDLEVLLLEENVTTSAFLDLLNRDLTCDPDLLQLLPEDLFHRAENLTTGMKADLDEELPEDFVFA